ncbi:hypothetical protein AK812_SmicGene47942 [Symbiodinium microadriaticum]|uniref:Uncharacterized protein n=1 Tax=Symbiodinium microadriaticum TaxID=2951 RepID=A0A1Q9BQM5_SYMMI|nr:hypothetical protein AK812_SmicGene47942 [Symbiodinium microadriaticum]
MHGAAARPTRKGAVVMVLEPSKAPSWRAIRRNVYKAGAVVMVLKPSKDGAVVMVLKPSKDGLLATEQPRNIGFACG